MIHAKGEMPAQPRGHRVMCTIKPPKAISDCGVIFPESSQILPAIGVIIHAGLNARDAMWDHGDEIGDEVWWGKFAGVVEEWDRIIEDGKKPCNMEDHAWHRVPGAHGKSVSRFECSVCKTQRRIDPLCVLNHDDILCNVTAERRRMAGLYTITRGKDADDRTQHFIERKDR